MNVHSLADRFLNGELMPAPRHVKVYITAACNLRCAYCLHFGSGSEVRHELDTASWIEVMRSFGRAGVLSVGLIGGEPFVRPDIDRIITGIVSAGMRFSAITNGTLIGGDIARLIASTGRCDEVVVSFDGSDAETNDAYRGVGSFIRALHGLSILMDHDVPAAVAVTVHARNAAHLERIADFFLEQVGVDRLYASSVLNLGSERAHHGEIGLFPREYSAVLRTLVGLRDRFGERVNSNCGALIDADRWIELLLNGDGDVGPAVACDKLFRSLAVRSDGVIVPCALLPQIELGSVESDDFQRVWRENRQLNALRRQSIGWTHRSGWCEGCPYRGRCSGGCPALAWAQFGTMHRPSSDTCLREFLRSGGEVPRDVACSAPLP